MFFNPALFHAAGANGMGFDGFRRVLTLLQVSSAVGKHMTVDSVPLIEATWKLLVKRYPTVGEAEKLDPGRYSVEQRELRALVQAVAEGYPFPTNLDKRPPGGGWYGTGE